MVVEEMNILTTVFLRFDNQKITIPNAVLATKAIHNFYRSPDMGDSVEFLIHVATPAEKISLIKHRINRYVLKLKGDSPLFMHICWNIFDELKLLMTTMQFR
jgi:small-conductance mechanosensitive channel